MCDSSQELKRKYTALHQTAINLKYFDSHDPWGFTQSPYKASLLLTIKRAKQNNDLSSCRYHHHWAILELFLLCVCVWIHTFRKVERYSMSGLRNYNIVYMASPLASSKGQLELYSFCLLELIQTSHAVPPKVSNLSLDTVSLTVSPQRIWSCSYECENVILFKMWPIWK